MPAMKGYKVPSRIGQSAPPAKPGSATAGMGSKAQGIIGTKTAKKHNPGKKKGY